MYQAATLSSHYEVSDGKYAQFISHLVLLSPLLPLDLYLIFDSICLINKRILEKEHQNSRFRDEFFAISHPETFSNLAHVQYAFLDKTGTMTDSKFQMSQIFFNGKIFQFESLDKLFLSMKTNVTVHNTLRVDKNNQNVLNSNPSREEIPSSIFENSFNTKLLMPLIPITMERTEECSPKSPRKSKLSPRKSITHDYKQFQSSKNIVDTLENFHSKESPTEKKCEEHNRNNNDIEIHRNSINTKTNNNNNNSDEKEIQSKINVFRTNQKYQTLNLMNYKTKELDKTLTYIDFIYDQDDFFSDFNKSKKNKGNFDFQELFECFSLCHSSKSRISPYSKQIFYESEHKEEESLLEFSKNCNFVYERSDNLENPAEYHIFYKNFKYKYQLMGINNFSYQRKLFSLVYKHPLTGRFFLICKGSIGAIRSKLSLKPDEEEKFENILRQFNNKGLIPMIYSKRELIKEEAEVFKKRMKNLKSSLINQSDQLEKLADDIEINLRVVCIVGFKNDLKPDAQETVEFFKSLNIDTWLLTGDTKENALQVAFSSNLIDLSNEAFTLTSESKNDLLFSIRNILSELKNLSFSKIDMKDSSDSCKQSKSIKTGQTYFKKCDKYIFLSGKSLQIIFSDAYLKPNFIFICAVVSIVIAFDLTPSQKALLVNMVQNSFHKNPSVLAIGDGYNDIAMLQSADIGVMIVNKTNDEFKPLITAGDLQLSSLKQLRSLMLNKALLFADRLNFIFYFLYYKSMIFGMQIFFYNFYDNFSGSVFFDSMFVFLYYNYFLFPSIMIVAIYQRSVDSKTIKKCPHLYIHGVLFKKKKDIKNKIIKLFVEVFTQTVIVFYLTIYSVGKSYSEDGQPFDKDMISLMCMYTCLIMNIIKIYTDFRFSLKNIQFLAFFLIGPLILLAIFLTIRPKLNFLPLKPYEIKSSEIFGNFILIMNLIFNGCTSFLISFALKHFWCYIFLPDPFSLIKNPDFIKKYRKNHSHILNLFYRSKRFFIFLSCFINFLIKIFFVLKMNFPLEN